MPSDEGGELVSVDFTASRQPVSLYADLNTQLNQSNRALDGIRADIRALDQRERREARWHREHVRRLTHWLEEERAANEPTDEEVLAVLAQLDGEASATEIAGRLYRRPTHSAIIRVGRRCSRLAAAGQVRRFPFDRHGEKRNHWEAVPNA